MSGASCTPHHLFFSTHNALAEVGRSEENDMLSLVLRHVSDENANFELTAYPFYDIEMVKRLIIKRMSLPVSTNVSDLRVYYRGTELPHSRSLAAFANDTTKVNFRWSFRDPGRSAGLRATELRVPPLLQALLSEVNLAMQRGISPKLTLDGTGGTYMLYDTKRQPLAMFKPRDEEAFSPNNPRGYQAPLGHKSFRSGVLSGEGASREVAAFLVDAQHGGHARVPQTTKAEGQHSAFNYAKAPRHGNDSACWKEGSFQQFVPSTDTCGDYDPRVFAIKDAHNIGILDLVVLNLDRNDGNILVAPRHDHVGSLEDFSTPEGKPSRYKLLPIDHGLILPDTMDVGDVDLVWYSWPQSKIPFSSSELRHIFSIDADKVAYKLGRKLEIREECLRTMRVTTRLLQIGANLHLNLFQIASLVVRTEECEQHSIMETAVKTALAQAYTAVNASAFVHRGRLGNTNLQIDLHISEKPAVEKKQQRAITFADSEDNMAAEFMSPRQTDLDESLSGQDRKNDDEINNSELGETLRDSGSDRVLGRLRTESRSIQQQVFDLPPSATGLAVSAYNPENVWDSSGSDTDSQSETSPVDTDIRVSKISGVPLNTSVLFPRESKKKLDGPFSEECVTSSISTKSAPPPLLQAQASPSGAATSASSHLGCHSHGGLGENNMNLDGMMKQVRRRPSGQSTRRRPTALQRTNVNSSWSLIDSNKRNVAVDWSNPLFEKTFFECFELIIKHHILDTHRDWRAYPFNGNPVQADYATQPSTKTPRIAHRYGNNNTNNNNNNNNNNDSINNNNNPNLINIQNNDRGVSTMIVTPTNSSSACSNNWLNGI